MENEVQQESKIDLLSHHILEEIKERFKTSLNDEGELDPSLLKWALVFEIIGERANTQYWKDSYYRSIGVKAA